MAKVNATSEQSAKITMKHLLATKGWTLTSNATAAYHSFIFDVRGRLLLVVFTRVLHAPASRNPNSEVWMKLIDDSEPWLRSGWTTHQGGTAFGTASVGNITYLEQPNGIRITLPGLTHPELVKPLYDSLVATAGPRHTIVALCEVSASLNADIEDALMGTCDNLESQPAVCKLIREARGSASFRAAEIHQFSSIITTDGALTSVPVEALTTIFTEKEGYVAHTLQFVVVTQDDVDRCVELLAQALPYLRHLKVSNGAVNVNINLTPMIEAALSSPFIESVSSFDKPFPAESADVSIALNGVRNPTADGTVRFRLISTNDLFLQRQVPYHPLRFDHDDGTHRSAPRSQVVIEFGGVRLPVEVHRASYATVLAELKRDSDDTGSADLVHKIPMVHEAEATVERRFDAKDLQLCVQWLNEYASDAQHEKCVKCREEPFYFISRASVAFYQTRIVVEGNCRATLQRLLSVLAAAHFLGVLSLEAQLQSILLTPHLTPYYPLM